MSGTNSEHTHEELVAALFSGQIKGLEDMFGNQETKNQTVSQQTEETVESEPMEMVYGEYREGNDDEDTPMSIGWHYVPASIAQKNREYEAARKAAQTQTAKPAPKNASWAERHTTQMVSADAAQASAYRTEARRLENIIRSNRAGGIRRQPTPEALAQAAAAEWSLFMMCN